MLRKLGSVCPVFCNPEPFIRVALTIAVQVSVKNKNTQSFDYHITSSIKIRVEQSHEVGSLMLVSTLICADLSHIHLLPLALIVGNQILLVCG